MVSTTTTTTTTTSGGRLSLRTAFLRRVSETLSSESEKAIPRLDSRQEAAATRLTNLVATLIGEDEEKREKSGGSTKKNAAARGVYLYGSPGRGKTVLTESFKDALLSSHLGTPSSSSSSSSSSSCKVKSLTFRALMDEMHENLMKTKNVRNPVREIGKQYERAYDVLIVDEVEVTDVGNARIWKAFVESYLESKKSVLVCTSNFKPKQLYKGGLNWKSLLVSEVLSERLDAVSLDGDDEASDETFRDYRKAPSLAAREETSSSSSSSMIFGANANESLRLKWEKLKTLSSTNSSRRHPHALSDRLAKEIENTATSLEAAPSAAYFDFVALCGASSKWSMKDYDDLSKKYEYVFLENIPPMDVSVLGEDVVRRFVTVIDALYANKTKLYCSSPSTTSIADLFPQSSTAASTTTTPSATTFISTEGGSSGRNATMLSEHLEWSATGLRGASLASLSATNFAEKSKPRCQSRLHEMKTCAYRKDDLL
jgi:predicted ATPase